MMYIFDFDLSLFCLELLVQNMYGGKKILHPLLDILNTYTLYKKVFHDQLLDVYARKIVIR